MINWEVKLFHQISKVIAKEQILLLLVSLFGNIKFFTVFPSHHLNYLTEDMLDELLIPPDLLLKKIKVIFES